MIREDQIEKYFNLLKWHNQAETVVTPLLSELTGQREWREFLKRHSDLIDYTGDLLALLQPLIKPLKHSTATNETQLASVPKPLSDYFFKRIAKRIAAIKDGYTCPVLDRFQLIALSDFYLEPALLSLRFKNHFLKEGSLRQIESQIQKTWYEINEILADASGISLLFDESRYVGTPDEVEL